jgi:hypothetical protein
MRKLLTAIGILFGAYAGWRLGAGFDGLISDFMERTPGHLQSFAFTGLFAAFGGYGFNRAAIALTRKPARVKTAISHQPSAIGSAIGYQKAS